MTERGSEQIRRALVDVLWYRNDEAAGARIYKGTRYQQTGWFVEGTGITGTAPMYLGATIAEALYYMESEADAALAEQQYDDYMASE